MTSCPPRSQTPKISYGQNYNRVQQRLENTHNILMSGSEDRLGVIGIEVKPISIVPVMGLDTTAQEAENRKRTEVGPRGMPVLKQWAGERPVRGPKGDVW